MTNPRVLVVGIDGTRFDRLGPETTPNLWALGREGFLSPAPIDDATPSWSGPCWATIATGVPVAEHGITGNDFTGHRLAEHPDFLTHATRAGLSTLLVVSGWTPLILEEHGGPLFAETSRRELIPAEEETVPIWMAADAATAELAADILATEDHDVTFVYLGAVDEIGHLTGAGYLYDSQVAAADEQFGRILAAVRARPTYADEDWTVIAVTDHGHVDEGGHGGREPEVLTAWIVAAGPGIDAERPATHHAHIAPMVAEIMGFTLGLTGAEMVAG